jgi:predicted TIM-barrel fold metal-dependent hydrolase
VPNVITSFFDSCTHPTLNGSWINGRKGLTFQELAQTRHHLVGYHALAIGLPGVGNYTHRAFKRECDTWGLEGVAAITSVENSAVEHELDEVVSLGYRGVKVHPRLLEKNVYLRYLGNIFALCRERSLVCLLCTYEADKPGRLPQTDPFYQLCDALNKEPDVRLILMHGGGVRLVQYAGLARHSDSIMIDLSFTILDNITQSSVQPVIRELLEKLDRRICVGSDSPEFSALKTIDAIQKLTGNLEATKVENIMSMNLLRFFPKLMPS